MANKKNSKANKKSKIFGGSKRRPTAYILFSNEKRQQIKNDNPGLSSNEVKSEIGALWKAADPQTKQHYQKLSDAKKGKGVRKSNNSKNKNKENIQNQSMEVNASQ